MKLEEYARTQGVEVSIEAMPVSEIEQNLVNTDAILLGPQVRFVENDIKKMVNGAIPVFCIDVQDFGLMRADRVWKKLMDSMK